MGFRSWRIKSGTMKEVVEEGITGSLFSGPQDLGVKAKSIDSGSEQQYKQLCLQYPSGL